MTPKLLLAALLAMTCASFAQANDSLVVYIECTQDGKISKGSGVLVSDKGHILTAKHVVPDEASCQASIGNNSLQKRGIRKSFEARKIDADFDATLMEFGKNADEVFPFSSVCPVSETLKGREIIAKGFDQESFGAPDTNDGILSNTAIDFDGMVQTTAETINGKSGGPVFLKDTDTVLGIVAGAQFTAQGIVSAYKMLAVNAVLDLSMLSTLDTCTGAPQISQTPQTSQTPEPEAKGTVRAAPKMTPRQIRKQQEALAEVLALTKAGQADGPKREEENASIEYRDAMDGTDEHPPVHPIKTVQIPTRDPSDKITLEVYAVELVSDMPDMMGVCLRNMGSTTRRIRIGGEDVVAPPNSLDTCANIHTSANSMQFAKQKTSEDFHVTGSYSFDENAYAGQLMILIWQDE